MLIGSTQAHLLRIEELRTELSTIIGKADAAKDGPEAVRGWIDSQRQSVESMIRTHEANLASIDSSRRLHGKLRTELGRGIDLLSPEQWAANAMAGMRNGYGITNWRSMKTFPSPSARFCERWPFLASAGFCRG